MRYPTFELLGQGVDDLDVEKTFDLIGQCINKVYNGETIHERTDWSQDELKSFLESMTSKQFKDVQEFFETMPKLSYDVKFQNPKTKKDNTLTLEGLQSFFV